MTGHYRGTLYSVNELAIFTDRHPDYGRTISVRNADANEGFLYNVGEYTGTAHQTLYHGAAPTLDVSNVRFGYGASKYFICNDVLYVFNGLDRKLPIFNEQTFVKSTGVRQAISSKQFQRYKKCTFVLHDDGTVGAYHVYNDQMERLSLDGEPFRLDSLCGCFTEATGLGSNQPYDVYLIGRLGSQYTVYQFHVNYINTEPCNTAVNRNNVFFSAKSFKNLLCHVRKFCFRIQACFLRHILIFAARGF